MANILEGTDSFTGINWWIGQVAPREYWAENTLLKNDKDVGVAGRKGDINVYPNRVKVRVVGYHDRIEDPNDLPFASVMGNPFISSGYGNAPNVHQLEGGESVLGIWIDGDDEQKPVITNVFMKSQHAFDGDTSDLLSSDTPRPTNSASSKDMNSPLDKFKITGVDYQDFSGGVNVFDNTSISNYSFTNDYQLNVKPKREDYPNTRSGAEKYSKALREYQKKEKLYDALTGRNVIPVDYFTTNTGKGNTYAGLSWADMLDVAVDSPSCKRDNAVSIITGALGDFAKLLISIEKYGEFYVNAATGLVVNFEAELLQITRKIGGIMTAKVSNIRDQLFGEIEEKINQFTNRLIPEELKPTFAEGLRGIMNNVFCLFNNVIGGLNNTIKNFLKSLVGKFVNAPLCAAEQLIGALLNDVLGGITDTIGPILSSLTSTLGGALGSVTSLIGKALNGIGLLFNFLGCDDLKCPLPSRFDNQLGPGQKQKDRVDNLMKGISGISSSIGLDEVGNSSIFKQPDKDPSVVASLVGECDANILRCGPPTVEIFGGSGVGGVASAIVAETTEIAGVNILDRGLGYQEKPPYVTFRDACGDGKGARAKAIINPDDGGIDGILVEAPGYGYLSNFDRIITSSGTIESNQVADGEPMTGQIDSVVVTMPGFGYNKTDTITAGNADLEPVVLGGRIIGVKVNNKGNGFTNIPEIRINSQTGRGATLKPVLKFVSVSEVSETLDPTRIISVVDCIDKPLSRNIVGEQ